MLKLLRALNIMKFSFNLDDIKYIKISYKDSFNEIRSVKAGIKSVNDREIIVCSKFENGLEIETPQEITLSIVCKDGLYKTKTTLKSVENDEPYAFFFLNTPQGFEYQQNREYFRVPIVMDCVYSIKQDDEFTQINAKTVDISANGICISVKKLMLTDNNAYISFSAFGKNIETKVKFIRSEKTNDGYLISFMYVNINETDRDLISQICIKKQLEQKRNSLF